jgi:hypothetical protein
MVTCEKVRELFNYDAKKGLLTWRVNRQRVSAGQEAGALTKSGHVRVKVDGKSYLAHRLVWLHWYGEEPPALIDHRDGDPANNRVDNLRAATKAQNGQNRKALGVSLHRATNKWRAYITHAGKTKHLGVFETKAKALCARTAAKKVLWTHAN